MKYSLGFMNWCSHDPAASIVRHDSSRGIIDHISAEEGFFSRQKFAYHFPLRSLQYCLDYFDIGMDEIDSITLDYMEHRRVFRTADRYRLLMGDFIKSKLCIPASTEVKFCDTHHLAHAYTAFLPSGFTNATVIVIDGVGTEQQTHSVYRGSRERGLELIFEQRGTGIGLLYWLVTEQLGWDIGEEGKTNTAVAQLKGSYPQ